MRMCPKCDGVALVEVLDEGVAVDCCEQCGGIWFDYGEMREVKEKKDETLSWMDSQLFIDPDKIELTETSYACPCCEGVHMPSLEYDNTGVIVEYCRSCRGLWLDKGEFEIILETLQRRQLEQSIEDYCECMAKEVKELVSGPKSFKEELHDVRMVVRMLQCRICSCQPEIAHHGVEKVIASISNPNVIDAAKSFFS